MDGTPVVVLLSFCESILTAIKNKQTPYWDDETNKCFTEQRTEMIHQCNQQMKTFGEKLVELCPEIPYVGDLLQYKPGPSFGCKLVTD